MLALDVSIFSAHSNRTASTSDSVNAQLPLAGILKSGGWSNARTIAEHYNKPISGNLGQTLLTHFDSAAQANQTISYLCCIFQLFLLLHNLGCRNICHANLLNVPLRLLFTTTYPIYNGYVAPSCWSSQALNSHGTL